MLHHTLPEKIVARTRAIAILSAAVMSLAIACADNTITEPPSGSAGPISPDLVSLNPTAGITAADPAPSVDDRILFDTRASLQQAASLGSALALWGYTASTRSQWGFTTNMDGSGTRALRLDWTAASGACSSRSPEIARTLPKPYPRRVYTQWKQRLGRTETGGGIGEIGQFDVFRPECGTSGRYVWMSKLDGSADRVEVRWPGPEPVSPVVKIRGTSATVAPALGAAFDPQAHTGETLVHTLYVQAQSTASVADGVVRLWVNGQLVIDRTGVATGDDGVYKVLFPWTSPAPMANQSEYFWDIVVWEPSLAPPTPTNHLVITPQSASVVVGDATQLSVALVTATGEAVPAEPATWASQDPLIATVSSSGLVTGVKAGPVSITATSGGLSASASVTVASAPAVPVASVEVTPGTASIVTGQNVQLTATPKDGSGAALTGRAMTWASSNTSVATVSTNGLVTGRGVGSATITATSEGKSGTATITATLVPVATVSVSPGSANLETGRTVQLSATLRDAAGATLSGRTVTWASSNTSVATVAANGTVSALTVGSATITATSEGKTGSAAVTVEAAPPPPPPPPPGSSNGIWMSAAQIQALPASGPAWDNLKRAADNDLSDGVLSTRDEHNVRTMAAGLVAARLNSDTYRAKVRESLRGLMANAISGSDPLAIVRRLGTYAIAADLIDLKTFDPAFDQLFRAWLDKTRKTEFGGETVAEIHERRPNNWGTHAGISRIAVAIYLGDRTDLERAALVYKGWLGDRTAYAGFTYNEVEWWQADPSKPVGINPKGATRDGHSIDGVLPDDQRRAGGFTWPPQKENYIYTALEGALGEAVLLSHQGYDVWNWSDRALLRAFNWLHEQANYPAEGNDCWQPYIINKAYGTSFPAPASSSPGKNIGWADWTHQR